MAKTLLKEYVDLRRESTTTSDLSAEEELAMLLERAEQIQHRLMSLAIKNE